MRSGIGRLLAATTAALALTACGDSPESNRSVADEPGERLVLTPDESWINVEGTVATVSPTSFLLDYGDGSITVEMDDWDWFQEGRHLQAGDRVAVTGRVDRDLLENAAIEASSVYVENLGTYFYASGRDEEGFGGSTGYMVAPPGAVDVTGYVTAIEGRELTLGTDNGSMRVDTTNMQDNPLDQEGEPKVRITDRVYVWGRLDVDAREPNELMAQGLIVLRPDRTKRAGGQASAREAENANRTAPAGEANSAGQ